VFIQKKPTYKPTSENNNRIEGPFLTCNDMNKRQEELQTEDGNSDKHEGVEEEPGMSKRSRDLDTDVNSWEPTWNDSLHLSTVHPNNNDNNNIGQVKM